MIGWFFPPHSSISGDFYLSVMFPLLMQFFSCFSHITSFSRSLGQLVINIASECTLHIFHGEGTSRQRLHFNMDTLENRRTNMERLLSTGTVISKGGWHLKLEATASPHTVSDMLERFIQTLVWLVWAKEEPIRCPRVSVVCFNHALTKATKLFLHISLI